MKLLFICHLYCPIHNAGGETTIHSANRAMVARGHQVTVICRPHTEDQLFADYEFEGVKVVRPPKYLNDQVWIRKFVRDYDPDLLLTHLDLTTMAMQISLDTAKPLAHFFHNTMSIPVFNVAPHKCQLAIFNSKWVSEFSKWTGPEVVVHPVVEPGRYRCERGTKITLVNPTPGKGADTFYGVSKLLPEYEFLTVKSVYGEQIAVPNIAAHLHPNVETMEHTADIREAFCKTKVLLMPSDYESFGRVAVEAACAGIPTIAHPTPGLLEALGQDVPEWLADYALARVMNPKLAMPAELKGGVVCGAAIFCHRDDFESWAEQIKRLMTDEVYYHSRSTAALKLAESLDPESEYDRLEAALLVTSRDARGQDMSREMWTADRRIFRRADGSLTDKSTEALSLYCAEGQPMPFDEAVAAGFVPQPSRPAVRVIETMNTDDLTGGKMVEGPAENKAISQPAESKSRKRKVA